MASSDPARTPPSRIRIYRARRIRTRRILAAGLLVVFAASAPALIEWLPASMSSTAVTPTDAPRSEHRDPAGLPDARSGALGEAGGDVPDDATVFDDETPGIVNLDPALLGALRQAATDAADDGVEFLVTSGWRSPAYQERLLQEAVLKYGSEEEAARWVATPETSPHVAGDGVDVGSDAAAWLSAHGAGYGLCQIYGNEPWHYELRPEAAGSGVCPAMYPDPTSDPRLQR